MRVVGRRALVAALTVLVVGTLTGCEIGPDRDAPVSIKRSDKALVVAFCSDFEVDRIAMEERDRSAGGRWSNFWEGQGRAAVRAGDTFSTAQEATGLFDTETRLEPDLEANSEVYVVVDYVGEGDSIIRASFRIGADGLSDSLWLKTNGTESEKPCGGIK